MNSKERVRAAIARQPVDKVPLGFYAVDYDTVERVIGRPTYIRNKINIQLALWEGRRDEVAESLKKDTVEFYRKIDCADIILTKEAQVLPPKDYEPEHPKKIADDKWQTSDGCIYQAAYDTNEMACIYNPEDEKEYKVEDFEGPVDVEPVDDTVFEVFDYVVQQLGDERYMAGPTGGITVLNLLGGSCGFSQRSLMMYILEPEVVRASSSRSVAVQNALDKYYIRPGIDGVLVEQDMAGTNAPLVSPRMFGEMCFPYLKERITKIKKAAGQVILHNCGNNIPIMDMLIETGIDCYQSLQTTAGMEVGRLKQLYGDKLSFWGGVSVEKLIDGTVADVRQEVRRAMERGAPGGGFILGPSHSIAKNTKYDNFMAMLDEFVALRDKF